MTQKRRNEVSDEHPAEKSPDRRGKGREGDHRQDRGDPPGKLDQHRPAECHPPRLHVEVRGRQPVKQRGDRNQGDKKRNLRLLQHRSRGTQRPAEEGHEPREAQDPAGSHGRAKKLHRPCNPQEPVVGSVRLADDAAADTHIGQKLHRGQEGHGEGEHPERLGHQ